MLSASVTYYFSIAVLIALVTVLVVVVVRAIRRSNYTPVQLFFYVLAYLVARILWRVRLPPHDRLPPGGAVIVCNHRGPFDPVFIQLVAGRVVHWMVASEYCQHPATGWFLRIAQAIPVSRGGIDTAATKTAIRYAQSGALVGMFPEGRLNMTDRILLPGRPGAALVALHANVPVIPCYISGSPQAPSILATLFTPAKATLKLGQPIDVSSYHEHAKERDAQNELTKRCLTEIARLAGVDDYEPQLAPRRWKPEEDE